MGGLRDARAAAAAPSTPADTGLHDTLAEVGRRFGPFDVAMVESGQYDGAWPDWHLGPEQAVEASRLVQARAMMPVHWALFKLASHGWTEPVERVLAAGACLGHADHRTTARRKHRTGANRQRAAGTLVAGHHMEARGGDTRHCNARRQPGPPRHATAVRHSVAGLTRGAGFAFGAVSSSCGAMRCNTAKPATSQSAPIT